MHVAAVPCADPDVTVLDYVNSVGATLWTALLLGGIAAEAGSAGQPLEPRISTDGSSM